MIISPNRLITRPLRVRSQIVNLIPIETTLNNQIQTFADFDNYYWQQNYRFRPYIENGASYEDYQPGYQTGHEGYDRYAGQSFDEAETELKRDYEAIAPMGLAWDKAKDAARDAWDQVCQVSCSKGDSLRDACRR